MDVKATQKFIVSSPKKLREVAYMLRNSNLSPNQALERLELAEKRAAKSISKVIKTAISNAKQANLNLDSLSFKEIVINEGPVLKRFRAGSRGRAKPYKKRMSHIRVILTVDEKKIEKKDKSKVQIADIQNKVKSESTKSKKTVKSKK